MSKQYNMGSVCKKYVLPGITFLLGVIVLIYAIFVPEEYINMTLTANKVAACNGIIVWLVNIVGGKCLSVFTALFLFVMGIVGIYNLKNE